MCVCCPRAQSTTTTMYSKKEQHAEHPHQHGEVVDNARRTAVSSMLYMHPADPPPHDFAGLHCSLALACPRHTGHAFDER